MLTPKLGMESISKVQFLKNSTILGADLPFDCGWTAPRIVKLYFIIWTCKMNTTPNFGVSIEYPKCILSSAQLTLENIIVSQQISVNFLLYFKWILRQTLIFPLIVPSFMDALTVDNILKGKNTYSNSHHRLKPLPNVFHWWFHINRITK